MKRVLLFLGMFSSVAYAQDCSKIFISEYVEGSFNNKALEIYNPTSSPVNLNQYFVARYSNGSNSATNSNAIQLSGIIQPYDVFVAVLDKRNPNGTGLEAPVWDSLRVKADGFFSPVYNTSDAFYWNGNDAVMLAKGTLSTNASASVTTALGFQIIDIFGKQGENPANELQQVGPSVGGAWSSTFPYNTGLGRLITKGYSLLRKPAIKKGVVTPVSHFNPLAEWDTVRSPASYILGSDTIYLRLETWNSLGSHNCDCNPLSTNELKMDEVAIYPNPTTDGVIYAKNTQDVKEVLVFNALGQKVNTLSNTSSSLMSIRLGNDKGVYLVRFVNTNGSSLTKRIVVK